MSIDRIPRAALAAVRAWFKTRCCISLSDRYTLATRTGCTIGEVDEAVDFVIAEFQRNTAAGGLTLDGEASFEHHP